MGSAQGGTVVSRKTWADYLLPGIVVAVVVALAVFVVGRLSSSPTQLPRPVVVASGAWAPFVGPELDDGGPLARIVTEALQRGGFNPQVTFSSWSLALERTRRGQVLGTFPFIDSQERREAFLLSEPLFEFQYVLFYSRETFPEPPTIQSDEDLRSLRVGITSGYDVWAELDRAVGDFVEYATADEAFAALASGEIDVLPEGLLPGRALIEASTTLGDARSFGVVEQGTNPLLGATEELFFMMPRTAEAADLMPRFDSALAEVRATELYADAVAALGGTGGRDIVELVPAEQDQLVELVDDPGRPGERLVAPRGTTALVMEWPDSFVVGAARAPAQPVHVRVKILDGPARGRVLYVDARDLRLRRESA